MNAPTCSTILALGLLLAASPVHAQQSDASIAPECTGSSASFCRQTLHDKFLSYAAGAFGPRALFVPLFPASYLMAFPPDRYSRDWREGLPALGRSMPISEDCCSIAPSYQTVRYSNIYNGLSRQYKFNVKTPWKDLSQEAKEIFLYGTKQKWTRITFTHPEKRTRWVEFVRWTGVLQEARERLIAAKSDAYRNKMALLMTESICPACKGSGSSLTPQPHKSAAARSMRSAR